MIVYHISRTLSSAFSKKSGFTPDFFIVSAHANHEVIAMQFKNLQKLIQTSSSSRQYLLSLPVSIQMQLHEQNDFIHTPQISSKTKLFCLGILRCGISVIQFALYYTRPPIPRYQFVITLITNSCDLWRQCVPGGLLLSWYYSADWDDCQVIFCCHLLPQGTLSYTTIWYIN